MKSIFVYNPESGKKSIKKHIDYILQELGKKYGDVECVETKYSGHAFEIARYRANEFDYFFVAGGDGTLNEVVNGLGDLEKKPILGYIPTGTVNDFSRSIGISRNWKKALRILVSGEPFSHDIFSVNGNYGIYVCCAGLFTDTSYATDRTQKKILGKMAYFKYGVKEIFNSKPLKISLKIGEEEISTYCSLILILNSKSVAGFKLNKSAKLDDGEVEIVIFKSNNDKITTSNITHIARAFMRGIESVVDKDYVVYRKTQNFEMTLEEGVAINLDGEKSGSGSFVFNVHQKALQILAPKKIQGNNYEK